MSRYTDERGDFKAGHILLDGIAGSLVVIATLMAGCPVYNVWEQGLAGEAALKRAEQDRRIAVQEAQAKMDSASLLAGAEIARAKGVAEANHIIGESLKNNEAYLRYLWVTDVAARATTSVVYVPTEANMPLLEAGKRPSPPEKTTAPPEVKK